MQNDPFVLNHEVTGTTYGWIDEDDTTQQRIKFSVVFEKEGLKLNEDAQHELGAAFHEFSRAVRQMLQTHAE